MRHVDSRALSAVRRATLPDQLRSAMLKPIATDEAIAHEARETNKVRDVPKAIVQAIELLTTQDAHLVPVALGGLSLLASLFAAVAGLSSIATWIGYFAIMNFGLALGMRGLTHLLNGTEMQYGPAMWEEYKGFDKIRPTSPAHAICLDVMSRPHVRDAFASGQFRFIERRLERQSVVLDPTVWVEDVATGQRVCILIYDGQEIVRTAL
jgi:hypothetical protein